MKFVSTFYEIAITCVKDTHLTWQRAELTTATPTSSALDVEAQQIRHQHPRISSTVTLFISDRLARTVGFIVACEHLNTALSR